ncbi:MAG: VCBS repeat-containing protein [Polyangia bacterium]
MSLPRSPRLAIVLRSAALFALTAGGTQGCTPGNQGVDDPGRPTDSDMGAATDPEMGPSKPCGSGGTPCPSGRICYMDQCIPDNGTCCTDDHCQNDTHCSVKGPADGGMSCGVCIAYKDGERDPMCSGNGFSASEFKPPVDRCRWPAPGATPIARDVVMTPVVVDLDGDGQPEIVFGPQSSSGPMRLVAIRGTDCSVIYDVSANLEGFSQIAAGDLDGDGRPEIVGLLASGTASSGHPIGVFNGRTGALITQSSESFMMINAAFDCSGPAIADLDGDGQPEVVVGGLALRYNRARRALETLWNKAVPASTWGTLSLINDMDGDGRPEVVSGNRIYDGVTGADKTPPIMGMLSAGGYPAIGDFNRDGAPDLVLVQSSSGDQRVSVIDVKNNKFLMPVTQVPSGWGGPPTVADFDGDGVPDFGTAGPRSYFVFSLDCLKSPKPAKCRGTIPGVLWNTVTKDASSGGTASSVFDFNGDGRAEVVYRDECWLRVYNGPDGRTVFARPVTSGTALEMPIVADVDRDGHADLIVPSDSIQGAGYCADQNPERETGMAHTGVTQGVFVLKDPMNRWMPSRSMWNQHTYHITNVNDDTTIPASEPPNWTRYNNYRQNVQGSIVEYVPQPDTTGRGTPAPEQKDCSTEWQLYAKVCNRGAVDVAPMLPSTFYLRDPRSAPDSAICTAYTSAPIAPGACTTVSCTWTSPPPAPVDLWLRTDDDGKGGRPQIQCKNLNDLAFLPGISCQRGTG